MTAAIVHTLLTLADSLDATSDELPSVAEDTRITLSALARACQLTAEKLKHEEAQKEAPLEAVG